ncbi:MAG: TolC family protein [Chthoniobacteraceae bacterium]
MNFSPQFFRALALLACGAAACVSHAKAPAKHNGGLITLEQAYDIALETDQSIRTAYWEVRKADLLPWGALAKIGPQINGSAGYSRNSTTTDSAVLTNSATGLSAFTDRSTLTHSGYGQAGITAQQPLIDFTFFPTYRLAKLSKVATRLAHQFTIRETLYGVAGAYYAVIKQQSLVAVNREALHLAGGQRELAQKRLNVGEVTRTDVLRAQVTEETARQTLVQSESALETNRNTLANILNLAPNTPFTVAEPPNYPTALPSFDALLGRAYQQREDLRVKDLAIDQDVARRGQVLGQYAPRIVAEFDSALAHTSGASNSSTNDWQATVTVQVPIFNGGQRQVDLRTAEDQIQETRLARETAAKLVESDVKQAWLNVRTFEQTLKAARIQVVAAEQGYHDLQNQYRAGTATSVDLLSALNDFNNARQNLAAQTYDYQVALRNLEVVSGVFQDSRVKRSTIR